MSPRWQTFTRRAGGSHVRRSWRGCVHRHSAGEGHRGEVVGAGQEAFPSYPIIITLKGLLAAVPPLPGLGPLAGHAGVALLRVVDFGAGAPRLAAAAVGVRAGGSGGEAWGRLRQNRTAPVGAACPLRPSMSGAMGIPRGDRVREARVSPFLRFLGNFSNINFLFAVALPFPLYPLADPGQGRGQAAAHPHPAPGLPCRHPGGVM